jgi:hypothetical protein
VLIGVHVKTNSTSALTTLGRRSMYRCVIAKLEKERLTITVSPDILRDFKNKCEKEKRCVSKMINSFMTYDVKSQISTGKILSHI